MLTAELLISAPINARSFDALRVPVSAVPPFQILLGWDAHIMRFTSAAHAAGVTVHFVVAPEISSATPLPQPDQQPDSTQHVHLRFGTARSPRLLRGALNMALLTEDFHPPTARAHHPFASGDIFPKRLAGILTDGEPNMVPRRIDGSTVPMLPLPPGLSENDPDWHDAVIRKRTVSGFSLGASNAVLQSWHNFNISKWRRENDSVNQQTEENDLHNIISDDIPAVLLPWNLANPGSIIPDLLDKASVLSIQDRFPIVIVVMPYNDVPVGLSFMEQVLTGIGQRLAVHSLKRQPIIFARAWDIDASLAVIARCQRVWIDPTDPEWRMATRRFQDLGLAVNFVSELPGEYSQDFDIGLLSAEEEILVCNFSYGPLAWRQFGLSLRQLAALARAVARNQDVPLPVATEKNAISKTAFDPMPTIARAAREFGCD